jgi:hypothetical protein
VIPTVYEILADSRDWLAVKLFGPKKDKTGHERVHAPAARPATEP